MSGGAMKATKRQAARLLKNQQSAQVDADLPEVPNAAKVIAKLEKRIEVLEDELKMRKAQWNKVWKWYKEKGGE